MVPILSNAYLLTSVLSLPNSNLCLPDRANTRPSDCKSFLGPYYSDSTNPMVKQKINPVFSNHFFNDAGPTSSLTSHDLIGKREISLPPNSEIFNSGLSSPRDVFQISSVASFIPMLIYKSEYWAQVQHILESLFTFQYISLKDGGMHMHDLLTYHLGVASV